MDKKHGSPYDIKENIIGFLDSDEDLRSLSLVDRDFNQCIMAKKENIVDVWLRKRKDFNDISNLLAAIREGIIDVVIYLVKIMRVELNPDRDLMISKYKYETPINLAIRKRRHQCVRFLLYSGAYVNVSNIKHGNLPIITEITSRSDAISTYETNKELVKRFHDGKEDAITPERLKIITDNINNTDSRELDTTILKLLVKYRVNLKIGIKYNLFINPLKLARHYKLLDAVKILAALELTCLHI